MIYFENTQDPQRVRIMRDTPNPGAVPTPGVEYSAGTNIDITANVISVTGLTSYPGYDAISGQVASQISSSTSGMQETLVSGENIKTVNGNSILGSGNLVIAGGQAVSGGDYIEVTEEGIINVTGLTSYPGYSAISGDVATQVEAYGYATESQIPDVSEFVTSADVKTQVEAYNYVTSGDVSTQLQTNHYTTSGDVKTQIESYDYATESQIPDVSEFVTSGDVKNQIEGYNYATKGDVTAATSGCQETLVSGENIKTVNGNSILGSGNLVISGGQAVSGGANIEVTEDGVINVIDITSFPGYSGISGDVATQVENYGYAQSTGLTTINGYSLTGDQIRVRSTDQRIVITSDHATSPVANDIKFKLQNVPTTGDIATQIEGYGYTTSGDVKTQIEAYNYVTSGDVATQVENYHYTTSGDVQSQITGATTGLQETLVSGTNIKTVNSNSLLGSGDVEVGDVRGNGVTGLWTGTQVQYDAITAKSNTILYFIHE